MQQLFRGASAYRRGQIERLDVAVSEGKIVGVAPDISPMGFDQIADYPGCILIPGFVDVHVHLREPGFSYKETIGTGTLAAARGGYTAVCAMPNLLPAPDCGQALDGELRLIAERARVRVYPLGALTRGRAGRGECADYPSMRAAVAFSDDGTGVQDEGLMREILLRVKAAGGIVASHSEDERFAPEDARSEWVPLERDLKLARETGCPFHLCHASSAVSVRLIREAKRAGLDVTAETAPHYLLLSEEDALDEGRFRMNPPLRGRADREALIEGLLDGTIDMIATDHAPHSAEEKSRGFRGSVMGVVGLETAFPVLNTRLVDEGILSLERLFSLMCDAPRARFGLPGGLEAGGQADLAVLDTRRAWTIDPGEFRSLGRSTPFEGWKVRGECLTTLVGGEIAWKKEDA